MNKANKTTKTKKVKPKTVKIWYIKRDGSGYWTDNPDWIWEFQEMADGDAFTIECKELSQREFNKLAKSSGEFDGW